MEGVSTEGQGSGRRKRREERMVRTVNDLLWRARMIEVSVSVTKVDKPEPGQEEETANKHPSRDLDEAGGCPARVWRVVHVALWGDRKRRKERERQRKKDVM